MQKSYFKLYLTGLGQVVFIIALFPGLSFASYGGYYSGSYGHYGYGNRYGYSRNYGYRSYGGYRRHGRQGYYSRPYYRAKQYNYSPSRHYRSYSRLHSVALPVENRTYADNNEYSEPVSEYYGVDSSAWQALEQGQYNVALNVFAEEAQSHPRSSIPKLGYALAIAALGDLERGVWAMRRAFRIDPDSLHYLQLNEKNQLMVDALIDQYLSQNDLKGVDKNFMISALFYINHNYGAAKKAIFEGQKNRDESISRVSLLRLIDEQFVEQGSKQKKRK